MRKLFYLSVFLIVLSFLGCKDPKARYEAPTWREGSAWQVLEKKGNYTMFLAAAKKLDFDRQLGGEGLYTVLAPKDSAFMVYLKANNYGSINDIPLTKLKTIIMYHVLKYSYKDAQEMAPAYSGTGYAYVSDPFTGGNQLPSMCETWPQKITDPNTNRIVPVYAGPKPLTFYNNTYFNKKAGGNGKFNYELLYPGVKWAENYFYAGNARILNKSGIPTSNGYVYDVDAIIEEAPVVGNILNEKFSSVFKVMSIFAKYNYSSYYSGKYARSISGNDSLYDVLLAGLALRPFADLSLADQSAAASVVQYSIPNTYYIPNNNVFDNYLQTKIYPVFNDMKSVPLMTFKYLIKGLYSANCTLPYDLANGKAKNTVGDLLSINYSTDVSALYKGSNGLVYGLNKMIEPNLFSSVIKSAFLTPENTDMAYYYEAANELYPLSSPDIQYTTFIPTNAALTTYNTYKPDYTYMTNNGVAQILLTAGNTVVTSTNLDPFVSQFIVLGKFPKDGTRKYLNTKRPYHVIKFSNDTVYYSDVTNNYAVVKNTYSATNGIAYQVNAVIGVPPTNTSTMYALLQSKFSKFFAKMQLVGYSSTTNTAWLSNVLSGKPLSAFIPTNAAMDAAQAAGLIPTDLEQLKQFISYHFVSLSNSNLTGYYLPSYKYTNESALTMGVNTVKSVPGISTVYCNVLLNGDGSNLRISNNTGSVSANVINSQIFYTQEGMVAGIDKVISFQY